MRRFVALISVLILGVAAVTAILSHGAGAQEETPPFLVAHPLVGAWVLKPDSTDPSSLPHLMVFSADGTVTGADLAGRDTIGSWRATGMQTAAITLVTPAVGEGANYGETSTVRGTVAIAEDDLSFTATYTLELVGPDGVGSGEVGPTTRSGTRIVVEPMGTPVSGPAL